MLMTMQDGAAGKALPSPSMVGRTPICAPLQLLRNALVLAAVPALAALAGCKGLAVVSGVSSVSPSSAIIDTNCSGCNTTSPPGVGQ